MKSHTKNLVIFFILSFLMLFTRFNHFGSSVSFPDASLAVLLLSGFFLARSFKLSLAAFALLLLEAGAIDYYATQFAGVSDWCITPAYWFLVPTYATMWLAGHWLASRPQKSLGDLTMFGGASCLAISVAFVISNGSFYFLSGRYTEMNLSEYAEYVARYYPPYLSGSLMYLTLAVGVYILLSSLHKSSITAKAG